MHNQPKIRSRPSNVTERLEFARRVRLRLTGYETRQRDAKGRSLAEFAFNFNRSFVEFDDSLREGQSQAGAREAPRRAGFELLELAKNARQVVSLDADAAIIDLYS